MQKRKAGVRRKLASKKLARAKTLRRVKPLTYVSGPSTSKTGHIDIL